jgi:hypothetical protein
MLEATAIIGLKIADDAGITWLDLGRHIRGKVQDTCVFQLDAGKEFLKGDMCAAVVEKRKDFAVGNMKVKCIHPLQEDDLRHPSLCIASISVAQAKVNFLKQRGFLYFPMTQRGNLSEPSSL